MRKSLAVMTAVLMLLSVTFCAQAAGRMKITVQPENQIAEVGGSMTFSFLAEGYTGLTWRFVNPEDGSYVLASKAEKEFPGLKVKGVNSKSLRLSSVPAELNGWSVFCTLGNGSSRIETNRAMVLLTGGVPVQTAEVTVPATEETDQTPPEGALLQVRAVGATIRYLDGGGNPGGPSAQAIDFTEPYVNPANGTSCPGGSVDVQIQANVSDDVAVDCWIINGVTYIFDEDVHTIRVIGLTESAVFEAVPAFGDASTAISPDGIQEARTGDFLMVMAEDAVLHQLNEMQEAAGLPFTEFEFTQDYTSTVTGEIEQGGRISVSVEASQLPTGDTIEGWRFNETELHFDRMVRSFIVLDLNASVFFSPIVVPATE